MALDWVGSVEAFVRIGGRFLEGRRYVHRRGKVAMWYLDSDVVENILPLRLVGFRQRKLWMKDATAWARSEVKDFDNISKPSRIDELMIILLFYLRLVTRKGLRDITFQRL